VAQCDALTALIDTRRPYSAYIPTTLRGDLTDIRDLDGPALDAAWAERRQMGAEAAADFTVALDEASRDGLRA
jgi:hypothetical protein